jgi:hypothetical protein
VLIIFQLVALRDVKERDAYGCEIWILLVPSAKEIPVVVLTIRLCGVDK